MLNIINKSFYKMSRSHYKFVYLSKYFWKVNLNSNNIKYKSLLKKYYIFSKDTNILHFFKGRYVYIHKGSMFKRIYINRYMVGYKYGNFVLTKKPFYFPLKVNQ